MFAPPVCDNPSGRCPFGQTYNGTVTTPYSVTGRARAVRSRLQGMHNAEERTRRTAANTASRALDPFRINVDTSSCDQAAA